MGLRRETVDFFDRNRGDDFSNVLAGGAAKCSSLDNAFYEQFEINNGSGSVRRRSKSSGTGMQVMEADWLATSLGLYYLNPALEMGCSWKWEDTTVRLGSKRLITRAVHVDSGGDMFEMKLGETSAQSLIWCARQAGR